MDKLSSLSIEKLAAFMDGNLTQDEMTQISKLADDNLELHQMLEANDVIDNEIASFEEHDLHLPNEIFGADFRIPDIDNVDFFSALGDSFGDEGNLYGQEGLIANESIQQDEQLNNDIMAIDYRTYGETGENIYDPIYIKQPDDHSCGLRSQQIVLRDFGIDIPFEDLERYALEAGVYSENGTYTYDIGKVVEMAGVGMHQVQGSTIYDLTNELAQGHRVIVSVDAHELWYNKTPIQKLNNWMNDVIGPQGGNHALIVAGVEVNPSDPKDVKVVLTDPGAGHLRIEYPLDQFMDAWKDSNCFMAATDCPAPYQYDATTGMEVPSNFYTEYSYDNPFVTDHGYQLSPDMINVKANYLPQYVGVTSYDELMNQRSLMTDSESAGGVGEFLYGHTSDDPLHVHNADNPFGGVDELSSGALDNNHSIVGTESAGSVGTGQESLMPQHDTPQDEYTFGGEEL